MHNVHAGRCVRVAGQAKGGRTIIDGEHTDQLYRIRRKLTSPKRATRTDGEHRRFVCGGERCKGNCKDCMKTLDD